VLSVEFTAADLGRTRVASTADPLAETVLALGVVGGRHRSPLGRDWFEPARRRTGRRDVELATLLHPHEHVILDLFTLGARPATMREGAATLASVDLDTFATELAAAAPRAIPSWLAGLRDGERAALRRLARAISLAHERLVAPYAAAFEGLVRSSREHTTRSLGERGVTETLARLTRGSWTGSTLHLPGAGLWSGLPEVRGRLNGQGMLLCPTVLCTTPVPYFPLAADLPAVLLHPVPRPGRLGAAEPAEPAGDRLLGRTRTAVLAATADRPKGRSTAEVAARVGVAAGTASEHLTVLRGAGLVASARHGHRMVHVVTPEGQRLLDRLSHVGSSPTAPPRAG